MLEVLFSMSAVSDTGRGQGQGCGTNADTQSTEIS